MRPKSTLRHGGYGEGVARGGDLRAPVQRSRRDLDLGVSLELTCLPEATEPR
jgi:hypothetical protein